jgi:hypothetical protein
LCSDLSVQHNSEVSDYARFTAWCAAMGMADEALRLMEGRGVDAAKSSVRVAFMNVSLQQAHTGVWQLLCLHG